MNNFDPQTDSTSSTREPLTPSVTIVYVFITESQLLVLVLGPGSRKGRLLLRAVRHCDCVVSAVLEKVIDVLLMALFLTIG